MDSIRSESRGSDADAPLIITPKRYLFYPSVSAAIIKIASQRGPFFLLAMGRKRTFTLNYMKFVVRDFRPLTVNSNPLLPFQDGANPNSIYEFYQQSIASEPDYEFEKEHLVIICVTTRMRICGWNLVSTGTVSETLVHPREVFRPVIARGSYGFIVCHNHPSGDPSPSQADIRQTKRLAEAAEILGLKLFDHIVIGTREPGREPYYSFREGGYL